MQAKAPTFFSHPKFSQQPNTPHWKTHHTNIQNLINPNTKIENPETYQTTTNDSSSCWAWATTRSNWVSLEMGASATVTGELSTSCSDPSWLKALSAVIRPRIPSNLRENTGGFEELGSLSLKPKIETLGEAVGRSRDPSREALALGCRRVGRVVGTTDMLNRKRENESVDLGILRTVETWPRIWRGSKGRGRRQRELAARLVGARMAWPNPTDCRGLNCSDRAGYGEICWSDLYLARKVATSASSSLRTAANFVSVFGVRLEAKIQGPET